MPYTFLFPGAGPAPTVRQDMPVKINVPESMELPAPVKNILDRFNAAGCAAYVVGGCVRDTLMGREPADWDVTTEAMPEITKEIFAGEHIIDTGIRHGTVTIITGGMPVETTTFRVDGEYKDSRHPENVSFTRDVRQDLARRDFTVNAIAYNPSEGFVDEFGGIEDMRAGIIRAVGDPEKRFNEDALRILRAVRFASVLGFGIDEATASAVHLNRGLLRNISVERIDTELLKLLSGTDSEKLLLEYGDVIRMIIPELSPVVADEALWAATARGVGAVETDDCLRLTMLLLRLCDRATPDRRTAAKLASVTAGAALRRMKFSKKIVGTVTALVNAAGNPVPETKPGIKVMLRDLGREKFTSYLKVKEAAGEGEGKIPAAEKMLREIIADREPYTLRQLAVNGSSIRSGRGGRTTGEILAALLDAVIERPELNTREQLLALAGELPYCGDI